jgi:hypothetical protein
MVRAALLVVAACSTSGGVVSPATAEAGSPEGGALDGGALDAAPPRCTAGCCPKTCAQAGYDCGKNGDGCGGAIDCGECTLPQFCGGGGYSRCGLGDASVVAAGDAGADDAGADAADAAGPCEAGAARCSGAWVEQCGDAGAWVRFGIVPCYYGCGAGICRGPLCPSSCATDDDCAVCPTLATGSYPYCCDTARGVCNPASVGCSRPTDAGPG